MRAALVSPRLTKPTSKSKRLVAAPVAISSLDSKDGVGKLRRSKSLADLFVLEDAVFVMCQDFFRLYVKYFDQFMNVKNSVVDLLILAEAQEARGDSGEGSSPSSNCSSPSSAASNSAANRFSARPRRRSIVEGGRLSENEIQQLRKLRSLLQKLTDANLTIDSESDEILQAMRVVGEMLSVASRQHISNLVRVQSISVRKILSKLVFCLSPLRCALIHPRYLFASASDAMKSLSESYREADALTPAPDSSSRRFFAAFSPVPTANNNSNSSNQNNSNFVSSSSSYSASGSDVSIGKVNIPPAPDQQQQGGGGGGGGEKRRNSRGGEQTPERRTSRGEKTPGKGERTPGRGSRGERTPGRTSSIYGSSPGNDSIMSSLEREREFLILGEDGQVHLIHQQQTEDETEGELEEGDENEDAEEEGAGQEEEGEKSSRSAQSPSQDKAAVSMPIRRIFKLEKKANSGSRLPISTGSSSVLDDNENDGTTQTVTVCGMEEAGNSTITFETPPKPHLHHHHHHHHHHHSGGAGAGAGGGMFPGRSRMLRKMPSALALLESSPARPEPLSSFFPSFSTPIKTQEKENVNNNNSNSSSTDNNTSGNNNNNDSSVEGNSQNATSSVGAVSLFQLTLENYSSVEEANRERSEIKSHFASPSRTHHSDGRKNSDDASVGSANNNAIRGPEDIYLVRERRPSAVLISPGDEPFSITPLLVPRNRENSEDSAVSSSGGVTPADAFDNDWDNRGDLQKDTRGTDLDLRMDRIGEAIRQMAATSSSENAQGNNNNNSHHHNKELFGMIIERGGSSEKLLEEIEQNTAGTRKEEEQGKGTSTPTKGSDAGSTSAAAATATTASTSFPPPARTRHLSVILPPSPGQSAQGSNGSPQQMGKTSEFTVLKPIAKGSFGVVYLARHKESGALYAMKVLGKRDIINKNAIRYVQREKSILATVDCPFVVKLHCSFQTKHHLFLVLDYLPGGDLYSLREEMVSLPESWVRQYAAEIVLALEYLHSAGITHRDVKPDNILLDSKGHLRLTDFGLSDFGLASRLVSSPRPASRANTHAALSPRSPCTPPSLHFGYAGSTSSASSHHHLHHHFPSHGSSAGGGGVVTSMPMSSSTSGQSSGTGVASAAAAAASGSSGSRISFSASTAAAAAAAAAREDGMSASPPSSNLWSSTTNAAAAFVAATATGGAVTAPIYPKVSENINNSSSSSSSTTGSGHSNNNTAGGAPGIIGTSKGVNLFGSDMFSGKKPLPASPNSGSNKNNNPTDAHGNPLLRAIGKYFIGRGAAGAPAAAGGSLDSTEMGGGGGHGAGHIVGRPIPPHSETKNSAISPCSSTTSSAIFDSIGIVGVSGLSFADSVSSSSSGFVEGGVLNVKTISDVREAAALMSVEAAASRSVGLSQFDESKRPGPLPEAAVRSAAIAIAGQGRERESPKRKNNKKKDKQKARRTTPNFGIDRMRDSVDEECGEEEDEGEVQGGGGGDGVGGEDVTSPDSDSTSPSVDSPLAPRPLWPKTSADADTESSASSVALNEPQEHHRLCIPFPASRTGSEEELDLVSVETAAAAIYTSEHPDSAPYVSPRLQHLQDQLEQKQQLVKSSGFSAKRSSPFARHIDVTATTDDSDSTNSHSKHDDLPPLSPFPNPNAQVIPGGISPICSPSRRRDLADGGGGGGGSEALICNDDAASFSGVSDAASGLRLPLTSRSSGSSVISIPRPPSQGKPPLPSPPLHTSGSNLVAPSVHPVAAVAAAAAVSSSEHDEDTGRFSSYRGATVPIMRSDSFRSTVSEKKVAAVGTPEYLAPELLLGHQHGCEVDWWALGIVIYEMLVGYPPFMADSPENVFYEVLYKSVEWDNGTDLEISEEVKDLVEHLLEKDPKKRFGSKEIRRHPWFQGMDWDKVHQLPGCFVPHFDHDTDTSYFEKRFERNPSLFDQALPAMDEVYPTEDTNFAGFSFIAAGFQR